MYVYNEIYVGLGAVGSSALYHAAKDGQKTSKSGLFFEKSKILGLEQYKSPHMKGSHAGQSRITRVATAEGPEYIDLVEDSNKLLKEIERESGYKILEQQGGIIIGPSKSESARSLNFLERTETFAKERGIPHKPLSTAELKNQYPQFNIINERAYFEPSMGFIRPENFINAHLELAKKCGAEIHFNEKIINFFLMEDSTVKVITNKNTYYTKQLILTAGAWNPEILSSHCSKKMPEIYVTRQTLYWFEVEASQRERFLPSKFPTFIRELTHNGEHVYGFPIIEEDDITLKSCIKLATSSFGKLTTPDAVDRKVSSIEINKMYQTYIKPYFHGVTSKCVKAEVCLYTVAPDKKYIFGPLSHYNNQVWCASACSGHGFKSAASIGKNIAQQVSTGKSDLDIIKRLQPIEAPSPICKPKL